MSSILYNKFEMPEIIKIDEEGALQHFADLLQNLLREALGTLS